MPMDHHIWDHACGGSWAHEPCRHTSVPEARLFGTLSCWQSVRHWWQTALGSSRLERWLHLGCWQFVLHCCDKLHWACCALNGRCTVDVGSLCHTVVANRTWLAAPSRLAVCTTIMGAGQRLANWHVYVSMSWWAACAQWWG